MANAVRAIRSRSTSPGISTPPRGLASGRGGKSSFGSPAILKETFSQSMAAQESGRTRRRTSLSGSDRVISYSFFAWSVMAPSVTTSAGHPQRRETSRSVADIRTSPARASASTFDRMGMEFFRSTMPWTRWSSLTRSLFLTLISIRLTSRCLSSSEPYLKTEESLRKGRKLAQVHFRRQLGLWVRLCSRRRKGSLTCGWAGDRGRRPAFGASDPWKRTLTSSERLHEAVDEPVELGVALAQAVDL